MSEKIRIGTRSSALAMWQANHVKNKLFENGLISEIVEIETKGDKVLNKPIAEIGSKGVFTIELEKALEKGEVEIAVHSAKDLQSTLDPGFEIIAIMARENPQDVLVSFDNSLRINALSMDCVIGTSSVRRKSMLKSLYPEIKLVDIRGNLNTRFSKMETGHCDAMVLAYAGVSRIGFSDKIVDYLDPEVFTPPVGQGALAIEAHSSLSYGRRIAIAEALNDLESATCVESERAFLKEMGGGCSIPAFCHARILKSGMHVSQGFSLVLRGGITNLSGTKTVVHNVQTEPDMHLIAGIELAKLVLEGGGRQILNEILNIP